MEIQTAEYPTHAAVGMGNNMAVTHRTGQVMHHNISKRQSMMPTKQPRSQKVAESPEVPLCVNPVRES